ncbi:MAG: hypothetical protein LBJ60_02165 [Tannerellaceae bacterium]|jgi:hypothetical protein|nr:hypothetical protein [Tannerellaceae bacterium]
MRENFSEGNIPHRSCEEISPKEIFPAGRVKKFLRRKYSLQIFRQISFAKTAADARMEECIRLTAPV